MAGIIHADGTVEYFKQYEPSELGLTEGRRMARNLFSRHEDGHEMRLDEAMVAGLISMAFDKGRESISVP